MPQLHLVPLLIFMPLLAEAGCETALQKALGYGYLDPEKISLSQRCSETFEEKRKRTSYHVCVFSGPPPRSALETLGDREVAVIAAEDPESERHFGGVIGLWASESERQPKKPGEMESVAVSLNHLGLQITRRRTKEMTRAQTIDKISLILLEENLRHERFTRVAAGKKQKLISSVAYDCEKNVVEEKPDPFGPKPRKKNPGDSARGIVPEGHQKVKVPKSKHRESGISGGTP